MVTRLLFLSAAYVFVICFIANAENKPDTKSESRMIFLSHREGHNLLFLADLDGQNPRQIFGGEIKSVPSVVDGVTLMCEPHWSRLSPNRKYFASWAYETGKPYSKYQGASRAMLTVGAIDGSWTRMVNPDCDEEFAWSPDSRKLAFSVFSGEKHEAGALRSRLRSTEIFTCGFDGSEFECVLEQPGIWIVLDWSPDGKRLLLERRNHDVTPELPADIYEFAIADSIADRKKSNQSALRGTRWATNDAPEYVKRLLDGTRKMDLDDGRYSPDGKSIAVIYCDKDRSHGENKCGKSKQDKHRMPPYLGKLAVYYVATKKLNKIADYEDGLRGPISWSADGSEILFSRYLPCDDRREKIENEPSLAVWSIKKDGTGAKFITTGWSPDSR